MASRLFNLRLQEPQRQAISAAAAAHGEKDSVFARRVLLEAVAEWLVPEKAAKPEPDPIAKRRAELVNQASRRGADESRTEGS